MIWFTADTHFGHANIIKYCARPFLSAAEQQQLASEPRGRWRVSRQTVARHDDALIDAINQAVTPDDTLWILGDYCWGGEAEARTYRDRIACKHVHLVWGNHDQRSVRPVFGKAIEQGMIKVSGQRIWLNHYPMRSWDGRFHGSWQLYGHVHGRFQDADAADPTLLTRDVGVDACDYKPISFDQLKAYMQPRVAAFEQAKARTVAGKDDSRIG